MSGRHHRDENYEDETENEGFAYCNLKAEPVPDFGPGVHPERAESIVSLQNKWVNGTKLHYYFFDRDTDGENVFFQDGSRRFMPWATGDEDEKNVVRRAFETWKDLGIGLSFEEVDDRNQAEIRIGFQRGDGYWSFLGKGVLDHGPNERTMNFGRNLARRSSGFETALHEIGHTLGLPHEHQSPFAGIQWDEEAVYAALAQPPNRWSRQRTFFNIIRKIPADDVQGSNWDRNSVMHYPFEAGLIQEPSELRDGLNPEPGLSDRDKIWIRNYYPPLEEDEEKELKPFSPEFLSIAAGEQLNFMIKPEVSRKYNIQTFGESDTIMVLFEEIDGNPAYVTADDDGGTDFNARIEVKLHAGRKYILRLRLYYRGAAGDTAVMMW